MILIINHKTPTMTVEQFYKQGPSYLLFFPHFLLTHDKDRWELKFGPELWCDEILQKHAKL